MKVDSPVDGRYGCRCCSGVLGDMQHETVCLGLAGRRTFFKLCMLHCSM